MEIRGDFRDIVDDLTEHMPKCTERYPSACSRTAMHAIELIEYFREQPVEVRRHLIAIIREAQRPYHWGDYEDLIITARSFRHDEKE